MTNTPWIGKADQIDDYDLPRIGHMIGVGEDIVHMVLDVESRGEGFKDGMVIKLFEEHVFYRNLPVSKRDQAVKLGIAWPKWRKNYKNNHATFLKAYEFNPGAALKACSWGLGQVLGENYKMLNYASPAAMVRAFAADEANQLQGMIDFIKAAGIDDELREMEKTTNRATLLQLASAFASRYNGPGYRKNNYHIRLVNRLVFWRGKPDTPWSPNMAKTESITGPSLTEDDVISKATLWELISALIMAIFGKEAKLV
jgi:hypothetical protein